MKLILGSSGSGKSYTVYSQLINESILNPDTNYIIIVPEQFNMQAQKDIINMHPNHGVTNIDILSFSRLAYRIFEEIGGNNKTVLEDTGKSMILRKVVELKKKELGLFSANIKKSGFINQLKTLMSELYQYNIDNSKLSSAINITKKNPVLNNKLKDISIIYDAFKNYLSDKFITNEEILDILSENICKSNIIKNSIIYLDSFINFTPSQYRLLEELMKYSKDLTIALTIDTSSSIYKIEEDYKLFSISQKTISKLLEIVKSIKIKHEEDILIKDKIPYRFKNSSALSSLEKNLFRYPYEVYKSKQNDISIHITKNPNDEIEYISKEITKLVRDKGYKYKDIAVVMGDMSIYADIIQKIFEENDIPCFIDNKKSILSNPFIELIRSVLEVIIKDFSYESIFRYLKCGLTGIETEDIDILENYVLALGIRGNSIWQKQWTRKYRGAKEIDFDRINYIRQTIVDQIIPLRTVLKTKKTNIKQFTIALWEFILYLDIENKLDTYRIKFFENKQLMLFKQYDQIYKIVIELLDKIVELLGDEVVSIQEYSNILDAGFEEVKMGLIPPSIDQITIGDIERTRLNNVKALFFIGVNDGIIPKINDTGCIISDIEKEILLENGIEMSPTARQNIYTEKFYLYLNLTKPSEKLYLSFSKVGLNGKSLKASYIIGTIMKLFSQIDVIDEEQNINIIDSICSKNSAIKYLAEGLRDYKDTTIEWKELYSWYYSDKNLKSKVENLIDAAFYTNKEHSLSKSVATALYGKELSNTITRLERYAGCAYAHFLSYGLELSERQTFKFTAPDMGNILHKAIELFSIKLVQYKKDWNTIADKFRDELIEACVAQTIRDYGNDVLKDSARNSYMVNRINRLAKRTIWALQQQIKKGSFIPSQYEVQFSTIENLDAINIALSEDERLKLQGRIDRLDKHEDENNVYLKIIDYKSGNTSFDIVAVYYGLQLQLVVYMNAAIELEQQNTNKNIIPAGIFYYNIDDPIIDKQDDFTLEEIKKEILQNLKMNGLANCDEDILKLIDNDFDGKSEIIDSKTSKSSISNEKFTTLSKYVNKKIATFGKEILNGNIEINPYKSNDKTACQYCKYNCICGFDTKIEGNNFRKLKDYSTEEIWKMIEKEIDRNGDDKND